MTVIPPAPARARRGRRGARALGWIAALAIALGPLLAPTAASADEPPTPSPTPTAAGTTALIAAPAGAGLVATGADAAFSITQRNDTERAVAAGTVTVSLSRSALTSQQAVDDWLQPTDATGDVQQPPLDEVARADVPELAAGAEQSTTVTVSARENDLAGLAPGVYPVSVSGPGGRSHTVITVPRQDAGPRPTAVIVPITAGPRTTGIIPASELAELTAEEGALTAALEAVTGTAAILAIDPAITASIRVLGSRAPASATSWLTELTELPNERFALQFGDADLATQVHAGVPAPLQPTTLEPYADIDDFTASGPATSPTIPDLTELTAVGTTGNTVSRVLWPASGTAGADVVAALDAQAEADPTGGDAAALTLVPSDTVSGAPGAPRAVAGDADLLVYDAASSSELARAAASDDTAARAAAIAGATAKMALTGEGPLVTAIDRPETISRASLRAAITAVSALPGATPVSLTDLIAAEPAPVQVAEIAASDDRVAALQRFLADEDRLATFATALVEPAQLTARERTSILQLLGNAWLADPATWQTAVAAHEQATLDTFDAVGIANPGTINFLATSAPISVTVRNDLPWPVSVVLFAETGDPRLIVQKSTLVEAGARQNTRVDVPVEARVGSGETALNLQLRSASAVPIGAPETIALTVRAEWESVGITAVIVIVVVLFAGGVVRTVLKLRRRRDGADEPTKQENE